MRSLLFCAALLVAAAPALAAPGVLAVSQSAFDGTVHSYVERFDGSGALQSRIDLGTNFQGGGVAIVGTTIYVSSFNSTDIRTFSLSTGAPGTTLTTGVAGYGSLTADATGLWANDGLNGNRAFHISFAGKVNQNPQLSLCNTNCSGIDYFTRAGTGFLIANENAYDGLPAIYDIYKPDGTLVQKNVFGSVPYGTGISYNAADDTFLIASSSGNDRDGGTLLQYSFSGKLLSTTALGGPIPDIGFGNTRYVSDIALVPAGVAVPEPISLVLLTTGVALMAARRRL